MFFGYTIFRILNHITMLDSISLPLISITRNWLQSNRAATWNHALLEGIIIIININLLGRLRYNISLHSSQPILFTKNMGKSRQLKCGINLHQLSQLSDVIIQGNKVQSCCSPKCGILGFPDFICIYLFRSFWFFYCHKCFL